MAKSEIGEKIQALRPACRVAGDGDKVTVTLEMPGVSREGLDIKVENSELLIRGRRERPKQEPEYLLRERRTGDFVQAYTLDETIDQEKIDAQLSQGILTVTLPLKESVKPRLIQVKTG